MERIHLRNLTRNRTSISKDQEHKQTQEKDGSRSWGKQILNKETKNARFPPKGKQKHPEKKHQKGKASPPLGLFHASSIRSCQNNHCFPHGIKKLLE